MSRLLRRAGFVVVVLAVSLGCATFDETRVPADDQTLGQEIVRTFCERMAADAFPNDVSGLRWKPVCRAEVPPPDDAPPRLVTLMMNRDRLAAALDATVPQDTHDDLGLFLGDMLPFYDPPRERLPTNTRLLASLLETVSANDDALSAMARIGSRTGYRPLRLALGTIRPILAYPDFDHFAGVALRALTDLPDDLPGGMDDGHAAPQLANVEAALSLYLASLQPAAVDARARTRADVHAERRVRRTGRRLALRRAPRRARHRDAGRWRRGRALRRHERRWPGRHRRPRSLRRLDGNAAHDRASVRRAARGSHPA
jgi:hypothetical protein